MIRHHYIWLLLAFPAFSETIVLKNGTSVTGTLVSMDAREIVLQRCGRAEYFSKQDVGSIQMDTVVEAQPCAGTPSRLEIPSGFRIQARLDDYVDSLREPKGQVFLATLDAPVTIDGRTVAPRGTRLLLQMVEIAGGSGEPNRTLDLIAIELRKSSWATLRPAKDSPEAFVPLTTPEIDSTTAFTIVSAPPQAVVRGERILVPSNTRLTFVLKQTVRLQ